VYKESEIASEMYFLVSGEVTVVLIRKNETIPYTTIHKNYYFGETALLFSQNNKHIDTTKTT
jgi:CRP-like cAMP-binding protein